MNLISKLKEKRLYKKSPVEYCSTEKRIPHKFF